MTDREINDVANEAILAADGRLARADAESIARAMIRYFRSREPATRLKVVYQSGMNCPSCWDQRWVIGRTSAECMRCGNVVPLNAGPHA
jgi:hypothetical protein